MNSLMTRLPRRYLALSCLLFALTGAVRIASACGGGEYFDVWDDGQTVFAAMSMTQQISGDFVSATATLTSPDGRVASADTGYQMAYQVTAEAVLPINLIDGVYSASGDATEQYADQGRQSQPRPVNPFIWITNTMLSSNVLNRMNGNTIFTVTAKTSQNCTGAAIVSASMGYPTGMDITITIQPPDGDGSQQIYTGNGMHTFGSQEAHQFTYSLTTGKNNQVAAPNNGANVTGYIQATPPNCTAQNAPGVQLSKDFTVN